MADKDTISEQLKRAILASGLTRYEIAKRSGVEASALSRFVHGQRSLSLPAVDAIAALLKLNLTSRATRRKGQ